MPTLYVLMALCISNHGGEKPWWSPTYIYISKAECEAELKNAEASVKEMAAYYDEKNGWGCAKAIV
jgi:hypothetical protein